jgi:hypothetical protein
MRPSPARQARRPASQHRVGRLSIRTGADRPDRSCWSPRPGPVRLRWACGPPCVGSGSGPTSPLPRSGSPGAWVAWRQPDQTFADRSREPSRVRSQHSRSHRSRRSRVPVRQPVWSAPRVGVSGGTQPVTPAACRAGVTGLILSWWRCSLWWLWAMRWRGSVSEPRVRRCAWVWLLRPWAQPRVARRLPATPRWHPPLRAGAV